MHCIPLIWSFLLLSCCGEVFEYNSNFTDLSRRHLLSTYGCDISKIKQTNYEKYFNGMNSIHRDKKQVDTCLPVHRECGWQKPSSEKSTINNNLPTFVLSVGLEGSGHHMWTEILDHPVHDCVWTNARHYERDIGDGVAKSSVPKLYDAITEQYKLRTQAGKPPCKMIYDSEDSFPTGAIRQRGRIFMRPDIINLQLLDGVLFNTKYLIILRNVTDSTISALRRNFYTDVDLAMRAVESTLIYMEATLRSVPCHKVFIAHYEHIFAEPQAFIEPLADFLELNPDSKQALATRLNNKQGRRVRRRPHPLTQFKQCEGLTSEEACYKKIVGIMEDFFQPRSFMWPTFAANGFDLFP